MKVNGYEIDRVSDEEFAVYKAIRRRLDAEWIAEAIRFYDHDGDALTQEEFERLVTHYEDVWRDYTSDDEDVCLEWAFDDILSERSQVSDEPEQTCHFEWRLAENGWADHICSNCGYVENTDIHVYLDYDRCPNCGAKVK